MRSIFSIALLLLLCTAFTQNVNAQTADTTISVKVKGITCAVDCQMIETNVKKLDGVRNFEVAKQAATASFVITYDPALVMIEKIYDAIERTGGCENPDDRPYKVKGKK